MTKLGEAALASIKTGVRLQAFDDLVLALVPAKDRDAVRLAMRLRAEFSLYLHAVADAVEWCERQQRASDDTPTIIIKNAMAKFGVTEKSLDRGWIRGGWQELNDLREYRKKFNA